MSAPSVTWDASYNLVPAGSAQLSQGDDAIRDLKLAISERNREHYGLITDTNSLHGWPKRGHGRAYFQAAAPTNKPEVSGAALDTTAITAADGTEANDVNRDDGRLWIRSTDYLGFVWAPSGVGLTDFAWRGISPDWLRCSIQGLLATGTAIVPAIVVPRAGAIAKCTCRVGTAPTGASILVDINKNGDTGLSIFSGATRLTIAAAGFADNKTTFHASNSILAADDYLTIDIDQVGSTIAGADFSLTIEYRLS